MLWRPFGRKTARSVRLEEEAKAGSTDECRMNDLLFSCVIVLAALCAKMYVLDAHRTGYCDAITTNYYCYLPQALKSSSQRPEKHLQAIYQSTKGIVFLGTPHHSSGLAVWAERLYRSIGMMVLPDFCKTRVLRQDSEVLSQIQDGFHTMIQSRNRNSERPVEIACFYEELPTPTVGLVRVTYNCFIHLLISTSIRLSRESSQFFRDTNLWG